MMRLNAFLSGLIFLHALFTAPFLVQCIPQDGCYLIEILGHDPCHSSDAPACFINSNGQIKAPRSGLALDDPDPCVDLMWDADSGINVCTPQIFSPDAAHGTPVLGETPVFQCEMRKEMYRSDNVCKSRGGPPPSPLDSLRI
jgi:hypothetical protein